jgi:hypothetical protein
MNRDTPSQPLIADDAFPLGQYEYMDIVFDLYGTNTRDGIEVEDVALPGSKFSLVNLFSGKQLEDFGYALEREAEQAALAPRRVQVWTGEMRIGQAA